MKRDLYVFMNNISVDDFGKLLFIIPFLKKTVLFEKQRLVINNLTYLLYVFIVLFIILLILKI